MLDCAEKIKNYLSENERDKLFFITFLYGMIIHLACYSTNIIGNPDTILAGLAQTFGNWEISLGRWGWFIFAGLRNYIHSNVLVSAISIMILSISTILLIDFFEIKNNFVCRLVICLLILSSPAYAMVLTYYFLSDLYAISILSFVLGAVLIKKNNIYSTFVGICLFILGTSIYQAYLGIGIGLLVLDMVLATVKNFSTKKQLHMAIKYIVCSLTSVLLYYVLTLLIQSFLGIPFSNYSGANDISIINSLKNFPISMIEAYQTFFSFFFNDLLLNNTVWNLHIFHTIIFGIIFILLLHIVYVKLKRADYVGIINIIVAILVYPLAINIIVLIATERSVSLLMAIPMSFVIPMIIALVIWLSDNLKYKKIIRFIGISVTICIIFSSAFMNNATYMARELTFKQTYGVALRILDRVEPLYDSNQPRVMIVGDIKNNEKFTVDNSIYLFADGHVSKWGCTWSEYYGNKACWKNIFRENFGVDIINHSEEEYIDIVESSDFKNMNIYPMENSVKKIDGIIVVKLSENYYLP